MEHQVFRDQWGVPHLRAADPLSLAYAQGRVTAVDRAWQIEVERHRAQGTSASFLGADAVGWDRFARQTRLADTAARCHANLDRETADWVGAYVDGVNAGLAVGARRAPQFAATGLRPGRWQPWTPLAVWLCHHILFAGFPAKLWRTEVARLLGDDAVDCFAADRPDTVGSNGWLLTGARTASGSPVVAGDPHRFIEDPGIYQQIRLACPAYDVVGLAVPGVPGIAHFGHGGPVAWAITNASADYQDLYAERLRRRADGTVEALGPDGWRPAVSHVETIEVAGGDPVDVEVIETERGPVIVGGPAPDETTGPETAAPETATAPETVAGSGVAPEAEAGAAISLRYPPRVRGELGFAALPALLAATSVADVDAAFDRWVEPVNVVLAADTSGGLLHRVAGAVPLRDGANGRRVVPAWTAGHGWRGWHPMPRVDVADLAVMANERGVSAPLGVDFAPPYRADRIRELLTGRTDWTAADSTRVHTDVRAASAEPLLARLADLDGLGPAAAALRDRLSRWDREMRADSVDAAAFAAVRAAVARRLAAHPALAPLAGVPERYPALFHPWLGLVSRVGFALPTLLRTELLPAADVTDAVRAAVEETAAAGSTATWGELHRLAPWQALPEPSAQWPGLAGDNDCVFATSSVPGVTHHCFRASAARYAWDLADREHSRWVVPFGASGVPGDPHQRDQLPYWLRGDLVPVVTDWRRLREEPGDDQDQ
ncbi:penicillin acylase family protein [Micromonospora sp. WMMD882]|uniref:penicillin acylase family protein n=1 Tax=Micromonospora sp. WMMD882 TaxID=3015151 RepID=UPI00248AEBF0|nr:penicillin acylase family protein [Micromonospora sp. WMMD882]WBB77807.1 penicillin acylase family protein [Micromonospora sp. WMMD882]